jgi:hypothetical protein
VLLYGVGNFICYLYVGVFEYVGYFLNFLREVYKCGPFALFLVVLVCCATFNFCFKELFGTGFVVKCILLYLLLCSFLSFSWGMY